MGLGSGGPERGVMRVEETLDILRLPAATNFSGETGQRVV